MTGWKTLAPIDVTGSAVNGRLEVGARRLEWGRRTYVMAVLNATPDSFSGDGFAGLVSAAVDRAAAVVADGADILDIGGESTRPGAAAVAAPEEIDRIIPVIEAVTARFDVPVSVDTYKSEVAAVALDAGAAIVNDVWALRMDPAMAGLVAERAVPVVLMHNRSDPRRVAGRSDMGTWYEGIDYRDLLGDVCAELMASVTIARAAGVADERIVLDPGIGFGKTVNQNLELVNRLNVVRELGFPVLVGPSRKSFIGKTLDLAADERLEGTAAAVAVAIARGVDIVRVHDVRAMVRVARMTDAIVRAR
jgi:dihydropteroate synthase